MGGVAFSSLCSIGLDVWLLLLILFCSLAALSLFFERLSLLFGASAMAAMFAVGGVVCPYLADYHILVYTKQGIW